MWAAEAQILHPKGKQLGCTHTPLSISMVETVPNFVDVQFMHNPLFFGHRVVRVWGFFFFWLSVVAQTPDLKTKKA